MNRLLFCLLLLMCMPRLSAITSVPYTEPLGFSLKINGTSGYGIMTVNQEGTAVSVATSISSGTTTIESASPTALIRPGKLYLATVQWYQGLSQFWMSFVPPEGYEMYINGSPQDILNYPTSASTGSVAFWIEIRPIGDFSVAPLGAFSGIKMGESVSWSVGLGAFRNGVSASRIMYRQPDLSTTPASRANLYYSPPSSGGDIVVTYDGASNQNIRTITLPGAYVDLVDDATGGGFTMKFLTAAGQPAPWKTIHVESPASNQLKITVTEYTYIYKSDGTTIDTNPDGTLKYTSASVVSLASAPAASAGAYTWTLREGDGTVWDRTTTHTSTASSGYPAVNSTRDDVVTVQTGDTTGVVVAKTKYHYQMQSWNAEALMQVIADPDDAALTTTYTYYTNFTALGNCRRVHTVTEPTGNWTSYQYYDDWNRRGQVQYVQHPYLDSPTAPPTTIDSTSTSSGRITAYDYSAGWSGRYDRQILQVETINATTTSKVTSVWTDSSAGVLDVTSPATYSVETVTNTFFADSSHTQTSYSANFRGDMLPDLSNLPYVEEGPDAARTVWSHSGGTFSGSTFTAGTGTDYWRTLRLHGSKSSVGADTVTKWGGQTFASVCLVANKSTMEATIRDHSGRVVRTETWVYTGSGAFTLLTYQNNTYDPASSRLLSSTDNNNAAVTNTYTNGRLTSTVDAAGTEIDNVSFDEIGRVTVQKKLGTDSVVNAVLTPNYQYAKQSAITTTNTYDAVGHITTQTVAGDTNTLTTTQHYDLAGRITQQVAPGNYTTGYDYTAGPRFVTVTLPGGATKTTEIYPDGSPKQISGTGVVGVVYTYSFDHTTGLQSVQEVDGGLTSSYVTTTIDWLGRKITQTVPGWNGTAVSTSWHYNNSGQLDILSQPGMANTLYVYDTLGVLYRQGLAVSGGSTLDLAHDRITETAYSLFIDSASQRAARQTTTYVYANDGSSTPVPTGTTTEYLSNLGSGVVQCSTATDIYGNLTSTTVTVTPGSKLVRAETVRLDSSQHAISIVYNGLAVEAEDTAGNIACAEYDDLGRRVRDIDPRTGTTKMVYVSGSNQVSSVTDPATALLSGNKVTASYTYDSAGRVATITNTLGQVARYEYTALGLKRHEWGDTLYPVEYDYDAVGRQTTMSTYRGGSGWTKEGWPTDTTGTADTTTWTFDDGSHPGDHGTGLLMSKKDAAGQVVAYTYTQAGQLYTRSWARTLPQSSTPVTTTYGYDPHTGETTSVTYNDNSTPNLAYTYDRLGHVKTAHDDITGTHTFTYDVTGATPKLAMQNEQLPDYQGSRIITWKYDNLQTDVGKQGRNIGFSLGTSSALTSDNDISYNYDEYGRFDTLTAQLASEATASGFKYHYVQNSNLIGALTESVSGLGQTRTYEPNRNLVSGFATTLSTRNLSTRNLATYAYTNDVLGRRTVKVETGEMYSRYGPGLVTTYGYNARSEVISSQTYLGTDPNIADDAGGDALQGRNFHYNYDSIGNRTSTTTNGLVSTYTTNNLNEIQSRTVPRYADVSGFASANATVTVANGTGAGQPTTRQFDYFYRQQPLDNSQGALQASLTVSASATTGAPTSTTRYLYLAKSLESFTYDADGNMTSDGHWDYTWDAENRLIAMQTTTAAASIVSNNQRVEFTYDFMGRRVGKRVYDVSTVNGSEVHNLSSDIRFVYSTANWHLLAEYDAMNSYAILRAYSWGLDLSGTTGGAGGVGGLLAIRDVATTSTYLPVYDANGNVFALVNRNGSSTDALAACYEYDAFGNTLRVTGANLAFAKKNPFRFSTKYTDAETQLIYYGYRYYNPSQGRFLGRDPAGEKGGKHLYAFCTNNAVNAWDYLGLDVPPEIEAFILSMQSTFEADSRANNASLQRYMEGLLGLGSPLTPIESAWGSGHYVGNLWIEDPAPDNSNLPSGASVQAAWNNAGAAAQSGINHIFDRALSQLDLGSSTSTTLTMSPDGTSSFTSDDSMDSGLGGLGGFTGFAGGSVLSGSSAAASVVPNSAGSTLSTAAALGSISIPIPGILPTSTGGLSRVGAWLARASAWVTDVADTPILGGLGAILLLTPTKMGDGEIHPTFDANGNPVPLVWNSDASHPMGRPGDPWTDYSAGTNSPTNIGGRDYSGHALDQMQGRGVTPSVVEDTIAHGVPAPGNTPGTTNYYNANNNVTVVVNSGGKVVTVIH